MKRKCLTLSASLGMLGLGATIALAQIPAPTVPVAKVADEKVLSDAYEAIKSNMTKVNNDFRAKVKAQSDLAKRQEMYRTMRPDYQVSMKEVISLASAHPKSEHTRAMLDWSFRYFNPEQQKQALNILLEGHVNHEEFGNLVDRFARARQIPVAFFEQVRSASENPKVVQSATYALAQRYLLNGQKKQEGIGLLKQLIATPDLEKKNPNLFHGAKNKLFVAENLSIGAVAPDIVGTDHAGVEFKLSDYRGKVVVLDFWGYW